MRDTRNRFTLKTALVSFAAWVCVGLPSGVAQVNPTPVFDVVSIRASNADTDFRLMVDPKGDEYVALGMPLAETIFMAYFPWAIRSRDRLSGLPDWVWNDKFDFVGKVSASDLDEWHKFTKRGFEKPNPMLQSMLRTALADRCKLVVHSIPATIAGFAIMAAKHGPNRKNLVAFKTGDIIPSKALKLPDDDARMVPILSDDEPVVRFFQTSMASFAEFMASMSGAPIMDKTGLTGKYNFAITRLGTEGDPSVNWDLAPLGLRLEPIKLPTETIVVDHIERPSKN